MSAELIAILGVGVALGGLVLRQSARIDDLDQRLSARIDGVDRRLSRVEGLLEGLGLSGRIQSAVTGD